MTSPTPQVNPPRRRRTIKPRYAEAYVAKCMLAELESHELLVFKGTAPEPAFTGHGVRVVGEQNALWYRKFCEQYETHRGSLSARCENCGGVHRIPTKAEAKSGKVLGRCRRRRRGWRKGSAFKYDTAIKRRDTIRALKELMRGKCRTVYAERLREFIARNFKYVESIL